MSRKQSIILCFILVAAAVAVAVSGRLGLFTAHDPAHLLAFVDLVRATPHARFLFVGVYAIAAAVAVPVTPLTLAGGALFGPVQGVALNWLADMLAATLAFGATRAVHTDRVLAVDGVELQDAARGFLGLLRLRVIPVVPFSVLNYGSAVYKMDWVPYLAATALGLIPTTVVYTLFAASLMAGAEGAGRRAFMIASISAAAIIALSLIPALLRRRRAARATEADVPRADAARPAEKRRSR